MCLPIHSFIYKQAFIEDLLTNPVPWNKWRVQNYDSVLFQVSHSSVEEIDTQFHHGVVRFSKYNNQKICGYTENGIEVSSSLGIFCILY